VDRLLIDSPGEYEKVMELIDIISPSLKQRVHLFSDRHSLFETCGLEAEIEKALKRKVWLESGGYIVIDKTEALTVIDVNTGKYVGKTSLADTILRTNMEAVKEIGRQLRLRDIGGIIIIDFIDMERSEDKQKVLLALGDVLKKDRTKTHLVGMTELGLVQITRKKVGRDLDEYLRTSCPYCGGKGRIYSTGTLKINVERQIRRIAQESKYDAILVEANPRLGVELLGWEGEDLERIEIQSGKPVFLRVMKDYHMEKVNVSAGPMKNLEESQTALYPGQEIDLVIEDLPGSNLQTGLGVWGTKLIEVLQGGNRVGETVRVIITQDFRSFAQAQIKE
jgi:ribonuclease G